jgi:hypothetical protein
MELEAKVEGCSHVKETLEQHVNKHKMYEVRRRRELSKLAKRSARTFILTEVCHGPLQFLQKNVGAAFNQATITAFQILSRLSMILLSNAT